MNGLMVVLTRAAYGVLMLMATVFGWHRANFDCKWRVPAHQPGADGVVAGLSNGRVGCWSPSTCVAKSGEGLRRSGTVSFLIAIVLPFVYVIVALLVVMPAWKRAVDKQGSYNSAWIRTLIMGLPFVLLGAEPRASCTGPTERWTGCAPRTVACTSMRLSRSGRRTLGPMGRCFRSTSFLRRRGRGTVFATDLTTRSSSVLRRCVTAADCSCQG